MGILDDGRVTDSSGRVVDCRNCVFIFTTNLGSPVINAAPDGPLTAATREGVMNAIRGHFAPVRR